MRHKQIRRDFIVLTLLLKRTLPTQKLNDSFLGKYLAKKFKTHEVKILSQDNDQLQKDHEPKIIVLASRKANCLIKSDAKLNESNLKALEEKISQGEKPQGLKLIHFDDSLTLKRNFRPCDPSNLKKIIIASEKQDQANILKEITLRLKGLKSNLLLHMVNEKLNKTTYSLTPKSYNPKLINSSYTTEEETLSDCDLFLSFEQKQNIYLTQKILSYGIAAITRGRLTKDDLNPIKYHTANSHKEIYSLLAEVVLQQNKTLAFLSNYSRGLQLQLEGAQEKKLNKFFSTHLENKEKISAKNEQREKDSCRRYKISHVINPVRVSFSSDLYVAQPIVFESLKNAKKMADLELAITQHASCFEEDKSHCPDFLIRTKPLTQSILDLRNFKLKRKLPLLSDILQSLYEQTKDGEYLIYTNLDIALMPHFYLRVGELLQEGYDGIVINRRTLSKKRASLDEINSMYAEIGKIHPGFDCFIFKREYMKKFMLGNACIGVHLAGRSLFFNLLAICQKLIVIKDEHLTFHIGDDNSCKSFEQLDYLKHNTHEVINVLEKLESSHKLYSRLKEKDHREEYGTDLLKFNFAPGKFITRSYNSNFDIMSCNSLEKPLVIHSRTAQEASFFMDNISYSKKCLLFKSKLNKKFRKQITLSQDYIDSIKKTLLTFNQKNLDEFYTKNLELQDNLIDHKENISWYLKKHNDEKNASSNTKYYYTIDCSHVDLEDPTSFYVFIDSIKEMIQKDGVKTIIHLIYKGDYCLNFKEALASCCHIAFFENKAIDIYVDRAKIKSDPFYQLRMSFELLCLNKTVRFD